MGIEVSQQSQENIAELRCKLNDMNPIKTRTSFFTTQPYLNSKEWDSVNITLGVNKGENVPRDKETTKNEIQAVIENGVYQGLAGNTLIIFYVDDQGEMKILLPYVTDCKNKSPYEDSYINLIHKVVPVKKSCDTLSLLEIQTLLAKNTIVEAIIISETGFVKSVDKISTAEKDFNLAQSSSVGQGFIAKKIQRVLMDLWDGKVDPDMFDATFVDVKVPE